MQLSGLVAGFDAKERSKLRKAVGKKLKDQMAEVGQMLLDRAEQEFRDDRGQVISPSVSRATVQRLYDAIKGAAEYSFNKSHSAAYARLAWQTAYLKANWPAAYGAAILGATDDKDKRIEALHSLAAEGIDVLPPDVNSSGVQTRPEGSRAVRLGLAEVKGTGEQVAARIVAARAAGAFTSMHDLVFRVRKSDDSAEQAVKASDLVALIEAGALDALGPRMGLFMMARTARTVDLPIPDVEWGVIERTSRQRNRLLTVVGENPLATFQATLRAWNVPGPVGPNGEVLHAPGTPVGMLPDQDGASVTTIGVLSAFATRTYRGGTMASLTIEGTGASIRGVMWDEALARAREAGTVPPVGSLIGATGRIQVRELETENDDGEVVTRRLREITVGTLHPVPVQDPVRGGLPDDVPVPELTSSSVTLNAQTHLGAAEADAEEKPSGLQIEALFGADSAPPAPPACDTSQTDFPQQLGGDRLPADVGAAPVVHLSAAGWIASDDASAPELRDTVTRLLAGSPVEGARLLWKGGRPIAVVADTDEVVAHIV